jgi:S-adenosylmethionine:tRNA ribosyltransferase-isomerase
MKLSQFRFNLPKELIAEKPVRNRDEARLLVLHRDSGEVEHRVFKELID